MTRFGRGDRDDEVGPLPTTIREALHPAVLVVLGLGCVVSIAAWFLVRSPMWLDEALTVNISKLPVSRIPHALRHDGHPPLYYVLLHFWMRVVGTGNHAVRALSGIFALAAIPLAWRAGKRLGGDWVGFVTAVVFAMSPFALRYASEGRMYSLLMLEAFAGFLVVSDALEAATPVRLVCIAVLTGAMLWTQYWAMWLIGAVGVLLIVRLVLLRRATADAAAGDGVDSAAEIRSTVAVIGALIVGGLLFIPWVPTLLYQSKHTGTPWAPAVKVPAMIYTSFVEFAGGPYSEPELFMIVMVLLIVIGFAGHASGRYRIELDLRGRPDARRLMLIVVGTILISGAAGVVSKTGFAPRYASVYFPFVVMLVALGLAALPAGRVRNVAFVLFAAFAVVCVSVVFRLERSQARVVADRIRATAPAALVVNCPDQLGPSLARELTGPTYDIRSYPTLGSPDFVNWVDYAQRNARNNPAAVAGRVLQLAGDRPIFLVYRDDFLTLRGQCSTLLLNLSAHRSAMTLVTASNKYYEPMNLVELPPPTH